MSFLPLKVPRSHLRKSIDGGRINRFIGLFPTDLSAIDVDWGSNDTIEEFTVTLSYQWWESVEDGVA